jgi:hypothetical protein
VLGIFLQTPEECAVIKEKVKKFIAKRNAREVVSGGRSGDADALPTPVTKTPSEDNAGTLSENIRHDGVEH